jgi:hypothetical protein
VELYVLVCDPVRGRGGVPIGFPAATPGRGGEEKTNEIGGSLSQDDPPAPVGSGGVILGYIPPPLAGWKNETHKDGVRCHGHARVAWPLAAAWVFARIAGRRSIARQFNAGNREVPVFPSGAPEGGGGTPSPVACLPRLSCRARTP